MCSLVHCFWSWQKQPTTTKLHCMKKCMPFMIKYYPGTKYHLFWRHGRWKVSLNTHSPLMSVSNWIHARSQAWGIFKHSTRLKVLEIHVINRSNLNFPICTWSLITEVWQTQPVFQEGQRRGLMKHNSTWILQKTYFFLLHVSSVLPTYGRGW